MFGISTCPPQHEAQNRCGVATTAHGLQALTANLELVNPLESVQSKDADRKKAVHQLFVSANHNQPNSIIPLYQLVATDNHYSPNVFQVLTKWPQQARSQALDSLMELLSTPSEVQLNYISLALEWVSSLGGLFSEQQFSHIISTLYDVATSDGTHQEDAMERLLGALIDWKQKERAMDHLLPVLTRQPSNQVLNRYWLFGIFSNFQVSTSQPSNQCLNLLHRLSHVSITTDSHNIQVLALNSVRYLSERATPSVKKALLEAMASEVHTHLMEIKCKKTANKKCFFMLKKAHYLHFHGEKNCILVGFRNFLEDHLASTELKIILTVRLMIHTINLEETSEALGSMNLIKDIVVTQKSLAQDALFNMIYEYAKQKRDDTDDTLLKSFLKKLFTDHSIVIYRALLSVINLSVINHDMREASTLGLKLFLELSPDPSSLQMNQLDEGVSENLADPALVNTLLIVLKEYGSSVTIATKMATLLVDCPTCHAKPLLELLNQDRQPYPMLDAVITVIKEKEDQVLLGQLLEHLIGRSETNPDITHDFLERLKASGISCFEIISQSVILQRSQSIQLLEDVVQPKNSLEKEFFESIALGLFKPRSPFIKFREWDVFISTLNEKMGNEPISLKAYSDVDCLVKSSKESGASNYYELNHLRIHLRYSHTSPLTSHPMELSDLELAHYPTLLWRLIRLGEGTDFEPIIKAWHDLPAESSVKKDPHLREVMTLLISHYDHQD